MSFLEILGIIGDLLAVVGFGMGLPLALLGALLRHTDRRLETTEVVLTIDERTPLLRWYAAGNFYARSLRPGEEEYFEDQEYCPGFVKPRNPAAMRLERDRTSTRICRALGLTFVVIGLTGFMVSFLPTFAQ